MAKKTTKENKPHNAICITLPDKKTVTVVVHEGGYQITVKSKVPKDYVEKGSSVKETLIKGVKTVGIGLKEDSMLAVIKAFILIKEQNIKPLPKKK